jgi:hypothetical protein
LQFLPNIGLEGHFGYSNLLSLVFFLKVCMWQGIRATNMSHLMAKGMVCVIEYD